MARYCKFEVGPAVDHGLAAGAEIDPLEGQENWNCISFQIHIKSIKSLNHFLCCSIAQYSHLFPRMEGQKQKISDRDKVPTPTYPTLTNNLTLTLTLRLDRLDRSAGSSSYFLSLHVGAAGGKSFACHWWNCKASCLFFHLPH